jgi:hypothetical protein
LSAEIFETGKRFFKLALKKTEMIVEATLENGELFVYGGVYCVMSPSVD